MSDAPSGDEPASEYDPAGQVTKIDLSIIESAEPTGSVDPSMSDRPDFPESGTSSSQPAPGVSAVQTEAVPTEALQTEASDAGTVQTDALPTGTGHPDAADHPGGSRVSGRPLPRIMAVANQKGGVGKTTTTVNLGAALAEAGAKVLVVDLDPQGNATTGLGINHRVLEHTMYDVLLNGLEMEDCIEPTEVRGLFVAPASLDLAGAEIELVPAFSRESKLKKALSDVIDTYDFVLIDCPPSLGLLTVNGLVAATEVLVPIQCEYYALEGLAQLTRNVDLVRDNLNPGLEISGIVLVMYDSRTKLAEHVVSDVREHFGDQVCRNVIPRNIKLSEAPSFGQPITVFDPSSRGAVAYRELAREVKGGA